MDGGHDHGELPVLCPPSAVTMCGDGDEQWCLSESDADDHGGGECRDDMSNVGCPVLAEGGEWELSDASVSSQQPVQQMPCPPPPAPAPTSASSTRSRSPRRRGQNKKHAKHESLSSHDSHPRVAATLSSNNFQDHPNYWWCQILQDILQQHFQRLPEKHRAFLLESLCSGAGTEVQGLQATLLLLGRGNDDGVMSCV